MNKSPSWIKLKELASLYDYFLFDCDGVLWYSNTQIGQSFKNIDYLESLGKKVYFVTNSSVISRKSLCSKLISDNFGYQNAKLSHLYPASTLSALYIKQFLPSCKKVWCIGMPPLIEEFNSHSLECIGGTNDLPQFDSKVINYDELDAYPLDPEVGAVVQGLDQAINYSKMAIA